MSLKILLIGMITLLSFFDCCAFFDSSSTELRKGKSSLIKSKKLKVEPLKTLDLKRTSNPSIQLSFSGYFRIFTDYRSMSRSYQNLPNRTMMLNGWVQTSQSTTGNPNQGRIANPFLYLETSLTPNVKSKFSIAYCFNHNFTGRNSDTTRFAGPFRLLNAEGYIKTKLAKISFSSYGGSGYRGILSPMTSGFNDFKFNQFYRLPWNWFKSNQEKNEYFYTNISLGFDPKLATVVSNGISGFSFRFSDLPKKFDVVLLYGKNEQTGGFFESNDAPAQYYSLYDHLDGRKNTFGVRVAKEFNKAVVGINYLNNSGYISNNRDLRETQYFLTSNALVYLKNVVLETEVGISEFTTPAPFGQWGRPETYGQGYSSGINQMFSGKLIFPEESYKVPTYFKIYSIGPDVVNINSSIINTTGRNTAAHIPIAPYEVNVYKGGITPVDQIANNRNGIIINSSKEIRKKVKINLAANINQEIENRWNTVTVQHSVNNWQRSQFGFFTTTAGPYGRILNQYIRSFEVIQITDSSQYKKGYYSVEFNSRYKSHLFQRPFFIGLNTIFNSVGKGIMPNYLGNSNAFINQYYAELNFDYMLHSKFNLTMQYGFESLKAGKNTISNEEGLNIFQHGNSFGVGFDWITSKNAGFYFRQSWFNHEDKNFVLDKFSGWNSMAEIKVFF